MGLPILTVLSAIFGNKWLIIVSSDRKVFYLASEAFSNQYARRIDKYNGEKTIELPLGFVWGNVCDALC